MVMWSPGWLASNFFAAALTALLAGLGPVVTSQAVTVVPPLAPGPAGAGVVVLAAACGRAAGSQHHDQPDQGGGERTAVPPPACGARSWISECVRHWSLPLSRRRA